tara:strand:+ start:254 stop:754 length:501 start_codon:yes stop_codon:yes gene_type:complete
MLNLKSSNGFQNVFSLDVFSRVFANTISNFGVQDANTRQYTPNFNSDYTPSLYFIRLIEQLTGEEYWSLLRHDISVPNYPRSVQFFLYLDDYVGNYHINISTTGLYDYEVYSGNSGALSKDDSKIVGVVNSGLVMVHNANFENEYFQNSESGVQPLTIPTTISYNG